MTAEIKKILDDLGNKDNYIEEFGYQYKRISLYDSFQLLDYITNLQQENEKLKEQLQNKGIIKTCENCEWFGTCPHSYREYDYKQRNEKAIELINKNSNYPTYYLTGNIVKELKNILNGVDENETK